MFFDEIVSEEYLKELQALEDFRTANSNLYHDTPIEQVEDPDTRRLIEALAFFSARSRVHGANAVSKAHERIFRQYFPYLLNPLPAMALVQFSPSSRLTQQVKIPKGTELNLKTPEGQFATFQTLEDTTITPLRLEKVFMESGEQKIETLCLDFKSHNAQIEDLEEIHLFVNHLNSFAAASQVYYTLLHCLESITAIYDDEAPEQHERLMCSIISPKSDEKNTFRHPIENIRSLLHLPEQELFLRIKLPVRKEPWQKLSLRFELNKHWPKSIVLKQGAFVSHVVPIVNLKKGPADPIRYNGTKDAHPILFPKPELKFELYDILSVSEILPTGSSPLSPGILGPRNKAYEIDFFQQKLLLEIEDAFIKPRTINVDALWSQPWFSEHIGEEIVITCAKEIPSTVNAAVFGPIYPQERGSFEKDSQLLLKILALKNQTTFSLEEIMLLMNTLKKLNQSRFKNFFDLIKNMTVKRKLDSIGVSFSMEYTFELKNLDGQNWAAVIMFFRHLHHFLSSWLSNFRLETRVVIPKKQTPLILKGGINDELHVLARNFFLH